MRAFALIVFASVVAVACSGHRADDAATLPTPTPDPTPTTPMPKVHLTTPQGEIAVSVEIAATEAKVERGLMFREHLPPDNGMIFLMSHEQDWAFWMRNTLIPLDMIFITRDFVVAGVAENAQPRTEDLQRVGTPSLYVLEVNGGWAAAHHIAAGTKVRFDGVPTAQKP